MVRLRRPWDGRVTVCLSANGGFMRKTNVNNSLQHAYATARGVGGVRQTRPSQEKPRGQVAGRAACTSILQFICVHRLYDVPQMCRPIELISRPAGLSNTISRQPQTMPFIQATPLYHRRRTTIVSLIPRIISLRVRVGLPIINLLDPSMHRQYYHKGILFKGYRLLR